MKKLSQFSGEKIKNDYFKNKNKQKLHIFSLRGEYFFCKRSIPTPGVDARKIVYYYCCMATPLRYFQKGSYYHVYNRGNRKQNIFIQYRDYERFLKRMKMYKEKFGVSILCYCLMPNHYHFLLRQETDIPITVFMLRLGTSYAKYFNIKYEQVGSLFQGRFRAKLIETDEYLLHLSRYIHRNPLEIQLSTPGVELADYRWSSYINYLNFVKNPMIESEYILGYFAKNNKSNDYKKFVEYGSVGVSLASDPWG